MKQYPARTKFKRYHKPNNSYMAVSEKRTFTTIFGQSGIQALEPGKLTYKQIEACRRALRRGLRKTGKIWIRVFPSSPVTKKSIASRMGKGKGSISHWIAPVRKGQVLFEISGWNELKSTYVLTRALTRLPIHAKIIFPKF